MESRSNLEVGPPIISQAHSNALHYPNLVVEGNIARQALPLISMSKIRDEALYGMFSYSAFHTSFGESC